MATTIKCAIVDDEPLAVELLASYVARIPFLELTGKYNNATGALRGISEHPVDLLFLDIQMPEVNGMELSQMLPESTRVVFTTAFDQYAVDGFRVGAIDYLLKPISYANFLEACNRALQWFTMLEAQRQAQQAPPPASIFVKSEYKQVQIMLDSILYIEGLKDYVKIYTDDRSRPVLTLMSMKALEEQLPSSQFMRVHRSYIVSLPKIREVERGRIVFGDTLIPVGDSYKAAFQEYMNR